MSKLLQPEIMVFLIPIVAIIGGIFISALKLNYKHEERIAKIKAGIDPDAQYEDEEFESFELDQDYEIEKGTTTSKRSTL